LRSIPDKLGGVIMMMVAILILAVLPFVVHSDIKRFVFTYLRSILF
jgi:quinol-cytochrome oxidoreductase complex cytochrome b subunit